MKKTIFSCLFGDYDELQPAPNYGGWDAILFTDRNLTDNKGWTLKKSTSKNPLIDSRAYKWLSHIHLPEYDLVCYIDANMRLKTAPPEREFWPLHPSRKRVFEEFNKVEQLEKADPYQLDRQKRFYTETRFRDRYGLYANGFFVRSHTPNINLLCEVVFNICKEYTQRDQLALPYAIHQTGIKPNGVQQYHIARRFITLLPHKPQKRAKKGEKVFVHHISPARSDKNFGKAINQLIEHLPEDDWICLRDIDTVPLNHVEFIKQCEEIASSNEFDLVGCMTNMVGLKYQLIDGVRNESQDMAEHMAIAERLANEFGSEVEKCPYSIAGVMMLFSKKTWRKIGKVPEGGIVLKGKYIDYWISDGVRKFRGRTGIAKGIYLWHRYRQGLDGKKHLL